MDFWGKPLWGEDSGTKLLVREGPRGARQRVAAARATVGLSHPGPPPRSDRVQPGGREEGGKDLPVHAPEAAAHLVRPQPGTVVSPRNRGHCPPGGPQSKRRAVAGVREAMGRSEPSSGAGGDVNRAACRVERPGRSPKCYASSYPVSDGVLRTSRDGSSRQTLRTWVRDSRRGERAQMSTRGHVKCDTRYSAT